MATRFPARVTAALPVLRRVGRPLPWPKKMVARYSLTMSRRRSATSLPSSVSALLTARPRRSPTNFSRTLPRPSGPPDKVSLEVEAVFARQSLDPDHGRGSDLFVRNRLDFANELPPSGIKAAKRGRLGPIGRECHAWRVHDGERQARYRRCRSTHFIGAIPARKFATDRHSRRLRHLAMRRLRRPYRWHRGQGLHHAHSAV